MRSFFRRLFQKFAFKVSKVGEIKEHGMRRDRAMDLMLAMNDIDDRFIAEAAEAFDLIKISDERKEAIWDRIAPMMEEPAPFADEASIERIKEMTFKKIREEEKVTERPNNKA